jgi:hypothetical protein
VQRNWLSRFELLLAAYCAFTVGVLFWIGQVALIPFVVVYFSGAAVSLAVLLLPALYFWETLPQLGQALFQFGSSRSFNGPVYESLLATGLSRNAIR